MSLSLSLSHRAAVPGIILALTASAGGAETGDLNGDGDVDLADAVHFENGLPPAPGSLSGFEEFACSGWNDGMAILGALKVEALRRSVPDALPHWWTNVWTGEVSPRYAPPDGRVSVRWIKAASAGGETDRVDLEIAFRNDAVVKAFFLILETEGNILRPTLEGRRPWNESAWTEYRNWDAITHDRGTLPVMVHPASILIANGRYVIQSYWAPVKAGEHVIIARARLPRGTRAGSHPVAILSASQAVLEDGETIRIEAEAPGEVTVAEDVSGGWDEGVPPLRFDRSARAVLGSVDFRLGRADGTPTPPGEPVASAEPGGVAAVRVQLRTDTPLNFVHYALEWPHAKLTCDIGYSEASRVLFANPEDGSAYAARNCTGAPSSDECSSGGPFGNPPWHRASFALAGGGVCGVESDRADRPFEYFEPLGEWVDLVELRLRIPDGAKGGEDLPLVFVPPSSPRDGLRVGFSPYSAAYLCPSEFQTGSSNWNYDLRAASGFVRVLGESPGEDPPLLPADLQVVVGDARGAPGDLVEIPVLASGAIQPWTLRLALEMDPLALEIDEVDVEVLSLGSGNRVRQIVPRGGSGLFMECIDEDGDGRPDAPCTFGHPFYTAFRHTESHHVLLDIVLGLEDPDTPSYPGSTPREILRLRGRLRPEFTGSSTEIRPAAFSWIWHELEQPASTGGFHWDGDGGNDYHVFVPASATEGGAVQVAEHVFLRGDANADGAIDIADALAVLLHLFSGGEVPGCLDAGDADDSGAILINDPVSVLELLFQGRSSLPPPYPACGRDERPDTLPCAAGCAPP